MIQSRAWDAYAPDGADWSPWAKPVVFAMPEPLQVFGTPPVAYELGRRSWPATIGPETFVIVDLVGATSVAAGLALAAYGLRPVPLFNGVHASAACLVDHAPIRAALAGSAAALVAMELPPSAPPCFLLDALRMQGSPRPRVFDNRWVVTPEDFPSANRLLASGLRRRILLGAPAHEDLAHVLLRYANAGIELRIDDDGTLRDYTPTRPAWFASVMHRTMIRFGLKPSSVGGFGAMIPEPQSGGG